MQLKRFAVVALMTPVLAGVAAPAFAATTPSAPRVRHVGDTIADTRAGKSVAVSFEYRCATGLTATFKVQVTQTIKSAGRVTTSTYAAPATKASCFDKFYVRSLKVTKTAGPALVAGRAVVQVVITDNLGRTSSSTDGAVVVVS